MATNGNGETTKKVGKKAGKAAEQITPERQLRVRREALGLSRARVADEAELPVSRVWAAEHEDAGVDVETRTAIVGVLNAHRAEIANMPPL